MKLKQGSDINKTNELRQSRLHKLFKTWRKKMKKLVIMMMLLAFVGANVAIAADSYTYDNKKGTVTFDHKAHQDKVSDCAKCHEGEPAKIAVDKNYGHKTCKTCHKEMNGPTKCNDCHKK